MYVLYNVNVKAHLVYLEKNNFMFADISKH